MHTLTYTYIHLYIYTYSRCHTSIPLGKTWSRIFTDLQKIAALNWLHEKSVQLTWVIVSGVHSGILWAVCPENSQKLAFTHVRIWDKYRADFENSYQVCTQEYLEPYLLGGFKFDMRLYVILTSVNPMKAYLVYTIKWLWFAGSLKL